VKEFCDGDDRFLTVAALIPNVLQSPDREGGVDQEAWFDA